MAISNHERIGRALKHLHEGLYPYFDREMQAAYTDRWPVRAAAYFDRDSTAVPQLLTEDLHGFLKFLCSEWKEVLQKTLGKTERTLISECQEIRNNWAHNSSATTDDTYRALDTISRLLTAISAPEANEVDRQKQELMRLRYEDQAKREARNQAISPTAGSPQAGLKPWREIATPHPDVASGRYQQAEFAADLWQVFLDEGSDEYRQPNEFFGRTYLTEGLKQLLANALSRLSGRGGDPVIELQTNFGGGKTHAMLSLYHLFSGAGLKDLPGLEPVFQAAEQQQPIADVKTVVLVGNKISPGTVHPKKDGTKVHTLWGEIAWQLGGKAGYELLREADETATNPGDLLKDLFNRYAPCLILVDEWVSYARQLHDSPDLPGGSFDTHFTFAQTLSESAKNADRTLLVVSIPESDIEIGGDRGIEARDRMKNAVGRVESPWRPASAEESFEIVRRRLFQNTTSPELYAARDAAVNAFFEMYRNQGSEFPSECKEAAYKRRLTEAYPIHPEFFDRLYTDWSTLDKFQRTRGVLRLMAKVIHCLWERQDAGLMIMPAHIPMDDSQIQTELTRYLDDNWVPIIEKDVDGSNSLPLEIDRTNPNLGRYSACRRVTRTIYLGSAPIGQAARRGLEDRRIKLGCVQPGETPGTFGDALRRLSDRATYLYLDGSRYWIANQPNVTRTAQDRAHQFLQSEERYKVSEEIVKRLKKNNDKGEFSSVHIAPQGTSDIPDDASQGVRLVLLGTQHCHSKGNTTSLAHQWVEDAILHKGSSPRYFKNLLIFLAPDKAELEKLEKSTAEYLAWSSIVEERETLNLDSAQLKQATTKRDQANKDVAMLLNQAYKWLLFPEQSSPQQAMEWVEVQLPGSENSPIVRASQKLLHEEHLISKYAGSLLRSRVLDLYLWPDKNHIDLKTLWDYFATYTYLPRIKNSHVLLEAVKEGLLSTTPDYNFAYAEGWDEAHEQYINPVTFKAINPTISDRCLLVKTSVARQQIEANQSPSPSSIPCPNPPITPPPPVIAPPIEHPKPRRFHGSVDLDTLRINRDASAIANEVIQHLSSLKGSSVKITLEIEAEIPDGVPENVVRIVTENCNTLKFQSQEFEID